MNAMQNQRPVMQNPMVDITDMILEAVRTVLPTAHAQMSQARLNMLQFRQASLKAMNQTIEAGLEADKQLFELAQAALPIFHTQAIQIHSSWLKMHEASISTMSQAIEQDMKTEQQLYDACLEMLDTKKQHKATAEDMETEVELEVELEADGDGEEVAQKS